MSNKDSWRPLINPRLLTFAKRLCKNCKKEFEPVGYYNHICDHCHEQYQLLSVRMQDSKCLRKVNLNSKSES